MHLEFEQSFGDIPNNTRYQTKKGFLSEICIQDNNSVYNNKKIYLF